MNYAALSALRHWSGEIIAFFMGCRDQLEHLIITECSLPMPGQALSLQRMMSLK
jgi:hypothetical protein